MQKYVLRLFYVGTDYLGWQRQAKQLSKKSIQESIEHALFEITGETLSVVGSGRTDSGVHSIAQTAHFILKKKIWDPRILNKALNSKLPRSIRVAAVIPVPAAFHAQRSAYKKQYSYYFQQGECSFPQLENMTLWIHRKLNVPDMHRAAQALLGRHDFKPFQSRGTPLKSTVREIFESEVTVVPIFFPGANSVGTSEIGNEWLERGFFLVRFRVVGSGFLKQMVRGIAGTLLQVGDGRRPFQCIEEILNLQDRKMVGSTAPAKGLWHEKVWYNEELVIDPGRDVD